jgi:Zn-finger nucleic acid-binding protein
MSERQNIEIDYCPKCRGVWLDRGELDKIIEKSAVEAEPARPPQPQRYAEPRYEQPRYEHREHKHYRRKSWLSDIFD